MKIKDIAKDVARENMLHPHMTQYFLLAAIAIFSIASPYFLSFFNLNNMIMQNAHVFVAMTGIMFVMQGGGFDLSVGYQISLISVVIGYILAKNIPMWIALGIGIIAGILCGTINGSIIAIFRVSPVIVTIITQELFRGLSYQISGGVSYVNIPRSFRSISNGQFLGISGSTWVAAMCIILSIFVFRYTVFGKLILAMGCDEQILIRNGIKTRIIKMLSYIVCGFFCSIAAILMISRQGVASAAIGPGLEIKGIMAACIAGISGNLVFRKHSRVSTSNFYIGVLVIAIIENGLLLTGNNQYVEYCIISLVVLLSVISEIPSRRKK